MIEYTHFPIGTEVRLTLGDYRIAGEGRGDLDGRGYLYVIAEAPVGSACVGAGTLRFLHVRGWIISWQCRTSDDGFPVSELEPVLGEEDMNAVRTVLKERFSSLQVCF